MFSTLVCMWRKDLLSLNLKLFILKNIFKDSADSPAFGFFSEEGSTLQEYERNLVKLQ